MRAGLLPRLTRDDIADGLKLLSATHEAPEFLRPKALKALLEAAVAHDAETFRETRAEHAGDGAPGGTPRYPSISPFIVVTLLTGMRFGEVVDLDGRSSISKKERSGSRHERRPSGLARSLSKCRQRSGSF